MHRIITISLICALLNACKIEKKAETKTENKTVNTIKQKPIVTVTANAETTPVTSFDDAADDPCIWIHPEDVLKSTIIGTNKQEGLEVYNLDGKRLYSYKIGRVNNVDIRNGFILNGKEVSVVTASNRTHNTISLLIATPTGELEEVAAKPITSSLKEVYGLGMYKSPKTNKIFVFMVGKEGGVEQWELFESNTKIDAKMVRKFELGSQGEGIVADDVHAKVYIGEENVALWKYDAEPTASNNREKVASTNDLNMHSDFEGVTIYDAGNGKGYIILSSQGNNSYAVFNRITNEYLGSFSITKGAVDGTNDTDGIDVTSVAFNDIYPKGFFIAQDGSNTEAKDSLHQNFKIIDWRKISRKLKLN